MGRSGNGIKTKMQRQKALGFKAKNYFNREKKHSRPKESLNTWPSVVHQIVRRKLYQQYFPLLHLSLPPIHSPKTKRNKKKVTQ